MNIKFDMANAERNFAGAIDAMGRLSGLDRRKIVIAEAGSVLKKAFSETPKAPSQAKLTVAGRLKAIKALGLSGGGARAPQVTVSAGLTSKGGVWGRVWLKKRNDGGAYRYRRTHDGNFHPLNQHYRDEDWALLQAAINDVKKVATRVVNEKKASAGLARQSWVLIADSLGIRLESVPGGGASASAISSAREARARANRQTRNGSSVITQDPIHFVVTLINRLPYGQKLGFQNILTAAIAGRAKYMQMAIAKGFTGSVQDMQRLFPGWTVTLSGN